MPAPLAPGGISLGLVYNTNSFTGRLHHMGSRPSSNFPSPCQAAPIPLSTVSRAAPPFRMQYHSAAKIRADPTLASNHHSASSGHSAPGTPTCPTPCRPPPCCLLPPPSCATHSPPEQVGAAGIGAGMPPTKSRFAAQSQSAKVPSARANTTTAASASRCSPSPSLRDGLSNPQPTHRSPEASPAH